MDGDLPEIYWYVFWIGLAVASFTFAWLGGKSAHDLRLKALEILRMYAEKGVEPPQAVTEQLAREAFQPQSGGSTQPQGRSALLKGFIGFLFIACVIGGLRFWLEDSGAANWMVFASQAGMAFFGFGAFGLLLAALFSRDA